MYSVLKGKSCVSSYSSALRPGQWSTYQNIKLLNAIFEILKIVLFFFRKFAEKQKLLSTNVDLKLTELLKEENPVYANNGNIDIRCQNTKIS